MDVTVLVVDAANVIGSRPDGWWRDRPGAAARLVARLSAAIASGSVGPSVLVVLEGTARSGVAEGAPVAGLRVTHAALDGDSAIRTEVAALVAAGARPSVVTADRALRAQVLAEGGDVLGPSWLLDRLVPPG